MAGRSLLRSESAGVHVNGSVYTSQTWVNVLVVVIQAAHASLRTINLYLGQRDGTRAVMQRGSVLAFSRALNQCQSLTHLSIRFLEQPSLYALGLAALPQSLHRLELSCALLHFPGVRPGEVKVLDLAGLRGLPRLTSVVLGPQFPLTCFVPVGLSRLTELDIHSVCRSPGGVVFQEGWGCRGCRGWCWCYTTHRTKFGFLLCRGYRASLNCM